MENEIKTLRETLHRIQLDLDKLKTYSEPDEVLCEAVEKLMTEVNNIAKEQLWRIFLFM